MRELGRPVELALYNRGAKPEKTLPERKQRKSQNEPQNASGRKGDIDPGFDNDFVDHDGVFDIGSLVLDDSGDESEDESGHWWQDIPRQLSSATTVLGNLWSETEENLQEYSPTSPNMPFVDPFAFSPSRPDSSEPISSSPVSALNIHQRLRPSLSSSTLASNNTTSSMSGIPWNNSPETSQFRSYPHRIVSPSQTLSSPSSNESLGSYPHNLFPSRPFSPNSEFPNIYRQSSGSPSLLHHSASMPNASALRSMPAAGGRIKRERTVTAPDFFNKPILTSAQIHRIEADVDVQLSSNTHDSSSSPDDLSANVDVYNKPILSLAQIHQIETETQARIEDHTRLTQNTPSFGTTDEMSMTAYSEPTLEQDQLTDDRYDEVASLEQDNGNTTLESVFLDVGDFGVGNGSLTRRDITRISMNNLGRPCTTSTTSPSSFRDKDYMGGTMSVSDSASVSARAMLRRVRSGSSLQTPMEVFEEYEEEGGEAQMI